MGKRYAIARVGAADHTATLFVLPRLGVQPEKELRIITVGAVPTGVWRLLSRVWSFERQTLGDKPALA